MLAYLFSFKGRATRAQFWSVMVLVGVIYYAAVALAFKFFMNVLVTSPSLMAIAFGGMMVVILWIVAANHTKRFHDMNRSGWWTLLAFVPIVNFFVSLFWAGFGKGTPTENRFGAAEPDISTGRLAGLVIAGFLVCMGFGAYQGFKAKQAQLEMMEQIQNDAEQYQPETSGEYAPEDSGQYESLETEPENTQALDAYETDPQPYHPAASEPLEQDELGQ